MKNKWNLEGILNQEHYRSIINLTSKYQDKENGLRQLHYRWALIENHDNINQTSFKKEMQGFFSNPPLKLFEKKGYVKLGIIKGKYPNNNLTNFLKKLSDPDEYGILKKKTDKNKINRYTVSEKFYDKIEILDRAETISSFNEIVNSEFLLHRFKHKKQAYIQHANLSIINFPKDIIDDLTKKQREFFDEAVNDAFDVVLRLSAIRALKSKEEDGIVIYGECITEKMESWFKLLEERGEVEILPDDYEPKVGESIFRINDDGDFIKVKNTKKQKRKKK